jgi:hypothetical protein
MLNWLNPHNSLAYPKSLSFSNDMHNEIGYFGFSICIQSIGIKF